MDLEQAHKILEACQWDNKINVEFSHDRWGIKYVKCTSRGIYLRNGINHEVVSPDFVTAVEEIDRLINA